jgi:tetratricopeptide (TPR) repeat protein
MKTLIKNLISLAIIVAFAGFGMHWWLQRGQEPAAPAAEETLNVYAQQVNSDIDFFQEKVAAGNWVFGLTLAQLNEKAFRLTNDYQYLAAAEQAARDYLEYEETSGAYALLSSIALTQHEFEEARQQAEQAHQRALNEADREQALGALFDAALALGDQETLQTTQQALRALPSGPTFGALTREARYVDRFVGDVGEAASLFTQACGLLQDGDDVWTRAWCMSEAGFYQLRDGQPLPEMSQYFRRITEEIYPDFPRALEAEGHIAALQGNYSESRQQYESALQHGSSPEVYLELAEIALAQNNSAEAATAWQKYVSAIGAHRLDTQASASAVVHVRGLVQALVGLGEYEEAAEEAQHDIAKRPRDVGAQQTLAFLYLVDGNYEAARQASLKIPADIPLTGEEAFVRGAALYKLGKFEEAAPYLATARTRERDVSLRGRRVWQELLPKEPL